MTGLTFVRGRLLRNVTALDYPRRRKPRIDDPRPKRRPARPPERKDPGQPEPLEAPPADDPTPVAPPPGRKH